MILLQELPSERLVFPQTVVQGLSLITLPRKLLWSYLKIAYCVLKLYSTVVVLGFNVPPTAKVIRRRDLGLKSHPKDWRSPGLNSRPLVYKAGSLTARPRRLLLFDCVIQLKIGRVLNCILIHERLDGVY